MHRNPSFWNITLRDLYVSRFSKPFALSLPYGALGAVAISDSSSGPVCWLFVPQGVTEGHPKSSLMISRHFYAVFGPFSSLFRPFLPLFSAFSAEFLIVLVPAAFLQTPARTHMNTSLLVQPSPTSLCSFWRLNRSILHFAGLLFAIFASFWSDFSLKSAFFGPRAFL